MLQRYTLSPRQWAFVAIGINIAVVFILYTMTKNTGDCAVSGNALIKSWHQQAHLRSKAPFPFIVAASYDLLDDPEAPKLQLMLQKDARKNVRNVSCLLEDVVKYPSQGPMKATALMSFPRSGNSWTRSLVEKSTGYATTAVYCETKRRFVYNCDKSSAFLMKTHRTGGGYRYEGKRRPFDRLVYLVRNPFDSILSYYKFKRSGFKNEKVIRGGANSTRQSSNLQRPLTIDDVVSKVAFYRRMFYSWKRLAIPTVVVRYEDLKVYPVIVLRLIRRFLLPIRQQDGDNVRLLYYYDNPYAFAHDNQTEKYLQREIDKLLCAIRTDLADVDLIYKTNKYDVLHSLKYYRNSTIKYIITKLREPLCFLRYGSLLKDYFGFTCDE